MCLAVPLEIIEINGLDAIAARSGVRRPIRLDFIKDPRPGDYVMVHAGFAIEKLPPEEARLSQSLADEVEAELLSSSPRGAV